MGQAQCCHADDNHIKAKPASIKDEAYGSKDGDHLNTEQETPAPVNDDPLDAKFEAYCRPQDATSASAAEDMFAAATSPGATASKMQAASEDAEPEPEVASERVEIVDTDLLPSSLRSMQSEPAAAGPKEEEEEEEEERTSAASASRSPSKSEKQLFTSEESDHLSAAKAKLMSRTSQSKSPSVDPLDRDFEEVWGHAATAKDKWKRATPVDAVIEAAHGSPSANQMRKLLNECRDKKVVVHGLKNQTQANGLVGQIESWDEEEQRFLVEVDDLDQNLLLKAKNMLSPQKHREQSP